MLVSLKEILRIAEEKKIAVGAFNAADLNSLRAIIGAAEKLDLPVVMQFAEVHETITPIRLIGPMMVAAAAKAGVPVCVHLDHGVHFEYLQDALDMGFTSVMYDGSTLPYEENVANTKKAVAMAGSVGASVEAEIGSMGRTEFGGGDGSGEDDETKIYTDPVQAAAFVRATGIDALACSFGTTHGIYLKTPRLDFSVVENVRRECGGIPVVMHGGSGVSAEDFRKAVRAGVRKINYFTYMDKSGGEAAKAYIDGLNREMPLFFTSIEAAARTAMQENIEGAMKVFADLK